MGTLSRSNNVHRGRPAWAGRDATFGNRVRNLRRLARAAAIVTAWDRVSALAHTP